MYLSISASVSPFVLISSKFVGGCGTALLSPGGSLLCSASNCFAHDFKWISRLVVPYFLPQMYQISPGGFFGINVFFTVEGAFLPAVDVGRDGVKFLSFAPLFIGV